MNKSRMIYLIHYKNLCKYSNVPSPITTIIIKKPKQGWKSGSEQLECKVVSSNPRTTKKPHKCQTDETNIFPIYMCAHLDI
jgi:hypothetical protein